MGSEERNRDNFRGEEDLGRISLSFFFFLGGCRNSVELYTKDVREYQNY